MFHAIQKFGRWPFLAFGRVRLFWLTAVRHPIVCLCVLVFSQNDKIINCWLDNILRIKHFLFITQQYRSQPERHFSTFSYALPAASAGHINNGYNSAYFPPETIVHMINRRCTATGCEQPVNGRDVLH